MAYLLADIVPFLIIYSLSFIALLIGSITDLKTREVPDWLNYGLVFSGLGINLMFSAVYSNTDYIINSIIGLSVFFGIAYMMFYAGQWGGGDSKILMGLGAMIGLDVSFNRPQFLADFLINALFIGAIYGLLWSIYSAFKNKKAFLKELKSTLMEKNVVKAKNTILIAVILLIVASLVFKTGYVKFLALSLALMVLATFYVWIFIKAVEKSSMYRLVEPAKLTEGDWIAKDVYHKNEYICGPKDLGIEKKQIKKLIELYRRGKVRKILIKVGIPFVPSFFVAFLVTLFVGNVLMLLL